MGSESENGVGVLQVPQGVRKAVQRLKEIVNCPESEIYFVLKECNMDPNEAVQRLLTQGCYAFRFLFHCLLLLIFCLMEALIFRKNNIGFGLGSLGLLLFGCRENLGANIVEKILKELGRKIVSLVFYFFVYEESYTDAGLRGQVVVLNCMNLLSVLVYIWFFRFLSVFLGLPFLRIIVMHSELFFSFFYFLFVACGENC